MSYNIDKSLPPEPESTPSAELIALAKRVRAYQESRRWSDAATLRRFPRLGSTKTYKRILSGDTSELDIAKQLDNYRSCWEQIKSLTGDADPEEELYDDIYASAALLDAYLDIEETNSLARVIILQGPTSSGKSAARRLLMRQMNRDGNRIVMCESGVVWSDSPMAMLGAMLTALGHLQIPGRRMGRYDALVAALRVQRRGFVIEEAQHMGPRCLNLLKTLVNNTPGEFVLVTIDTLWKRLETAAYEECRQISSNRLARRINLGSDVRADDVHTIIARRLGMSPDLASRATSLVMPHLATKGRLAFLRGVCDRALDTADGDPITLPAFEAAVAAELKAR